MSFSELSPVVTSIHEPRHHWPNRGALQSGVTGPGSQTQYLSAYGVIPGTSFRSPEGSAKLISDPPVRTGKLYHMVTCE